MKARAVRRILTGAWTAILVLAFAPLAAADIVVEGSPGFIQAVEDCFASIQMVGGSAADTLNQLFGSGNTHVIKESSKKNSTTPNDKTKSENGTGTGSTVTWDPNHKAPYTDGTPRDPCASLFHELVHAADIDNGKIDPSPGANGIMNAEIKACTEENKYRKAKGLPQRKKYGSKDLPPSAIMSVLRDDEPVATEVSHVVD